jgi:hypothetical protein
MKHVGKWILALFFCLGNWYPLMSQTDSARTVKRSALRPASLQLHLGLGFTQSSYLVQSDYQQMAPNNELFFDSLKGYGRTRFARPLVLSLGLGLNLKKPEWKKLSCKIELFYHRPSTQQTFYSYVDTVGYFRFYSPKTGVEIGVDSVVIREYLFNYHSQNLLCNFNANYEVLSRKRSALFIGISVGAGVVHHYVVAKYNYGDENYKIKDAFINNYRTYNFHADRVEKTNLPPGIMFNLSFPTGLVVRKSLSIELRYGYRFTKLPGQNYIARPHIFGTLGFTIKRRFKQKDR